MNEEEAELAGHIYDAMMRASKHSPRGQQAAAFRVGISDLGFCSERVRRMLARSEETDDPDLLPAFIGTAIGDHVERAIAGGWTDVILGAEVTVTLEGDTGTYTINGHPDVLLTNSGIVIDAKTDRGLHIVRRTGPSRQQQFQRHLYALGAWTKGYFPDHALNEVRVANVWIDRAADEREVHVQMEPYDPAIVDEATAWIDEVVYNHLHDETSRKEPPIEMCRVVCQFFADCRAGDIGVEGLLTDERVLTALEMYQEGLAMEKAGKQLKDQANGNLRGVQGSTGTHSLRWVHVNGGPVSYDRPDYDRLTIQELK